MLTEGSASSSAAVLDWLRECEISTLADIERILNSGPNCAAGCCRIQNSEADLNLLKHYTNAYAGWQAAQREQRERMQNA